MTRTIQRQRLSTALLASTILTATPFAAAAQQPTDEIIVRGVNIPDEKRSTPEISNVLDEEALLRTGDDDIAAALGRVAGLSVSDGFVFVRGLNERYTSATINGSPLPSPEPLRRTIPLDLFPTSVLSGSLVQKTYSPEFSGEFGGGAIDLRTKSLPEEFFYEVKGTVGVDDIATFSEAPIYDGGRRDWTGWDDGTRNIPGALEPFFGTNINSLPIEQRAAIAQDFDNSKTLILSEDDLPVNYGVESSIGHRIDVSQDLSLGFVASAGYSNNWQVREGVRARGVGNAGDGTFQFSTNSLLLGSPDFIEQESGAGAPFQSDSEGGVTQSINEVQLNGLASVGAEFLDNHEVSVTGLFLRKTNKETRIEEGREGDGQFIRSEYAEWFENQVWQVQLRGDHLYPSLRDLGVSWRVAYGEAFRDSPYQRQTNYTREVQNGQLGPVFFEPSSNQINETTTIRFEKVEDENFDAGVDLNLPLFIADNNFELKAGGAFRDNHREALSREYIIDVDSAPNGGAYQQLRGDAVRADLALSDTIFENQILQLIQPGIGLPTDYTGDLDVRSGYVGVEGELGAYFRINAGGRYENSSQRVFTETAGVAGQGPEIEIKEDYFLPAVTLTWLPVGDLQVRGAYSQTIVRPQFRELGPSIFVDNESDLRFAGNPFLENSEIHNFDVRAEYYFGRGQFVTIGGFYKDIDKPIEEYLTTIGATPTTSFINAPSADLYGFEFEFEKRFLLADFFDYGFLETKDLILKANYTFSQSEVSADGDVTIFRSVTGGDVSNAFDVNDGEVIDGNGFIEDGRSLQGQSDHLFNLQIGYEDPEANSRATILVNFASERIFRVGSLASFGGGVTVEEPNVLERPPVTVDFVYNRGFEMYGGDYEIGLEIRNILGEDFDATQNLENDSVAFDRYDIGRTVSMSLKKRF